MRAADDTWDITTSVGATALNVAAARALEAKKPRPLAVDQYAELFCRAVGGEWADVLDGNAPSHRLVSSEYGKPFVDFQAVRTRYFDNYFRTAADAGVQQIVILAAGLDSRAYRLAWPGGTVIFELDQPQVLDFKHQTLTGHGVQPAADRRQIPVDLRQDWPRALNDAGFDATRPSAWIAEGLLIYLTAEAQEQLFSGIHAQAARGSHVAIEESAPISSKDHTAGIEKERTGGSDWVFYQLIYNQQCAPAADWFGSRGWAATATPLADALREANRLIPGPDTDLGLLMHRHTLVTATR